MRCWMVLGALLVSMNAALAGMPPPPPPAAEMRELHVMAGEWTCAEEMGPATGTGRMTGRLGPGAHTVLSEYESIGGPMQGFQLHEVITYSPGDGKYRIYFSDPYTQGVTVATGTKVGRDIVLERVAKHGDVEIKKRSVLTFTGPDAFDMESLSSRDGVTFKRDLLLRFKRKR